MRAETIVECREVQCVGMQDDAAVADEHGRTPRPETVAEATVAEAT